MPSRARAMLACAFLVAILVPGWPLLSRQAPGQAPVSQGLYNIDAWTRASRALAAGDFDGALRGYCEMFEGGGAGDLWTVSAILLCDPGQIQGFVASIEKLQPVFVQARVFQGQMCYRVCAGVTRDRNEAVRWRALLPERLLTEGPFPVLITRPCEQPPAMGVAKIPAPSPAPAQTEGGAAPPSKTAVSPDALRLPPAQEPSPPAVSPAKRAEGEAWFQKGLAAQAKGNRSEAMQDYKLALDADPRRPEILNNMGVLYLQEERYDKAKALFDQALEHSPAYARAHLNLAGALWGMGDRDAATISARKAALLDPTDVSAHLTLSSFLLAQGERTDAAAEANRALLLDPGNAQAKALLLSLSPDKGSGSNR